MQTLAVAALAALVYANSLSGDFVFDDRKAVVENADLLPTRPWMDLVRHDFWGDPIDEEVSHKSYRPLTVATYRLNYAADRLRPEGYHAVNVALHALASALFLRLARRVMRDGEGALAAALLFAAHPIHTEAVAGIVGRAEVLSCVLFLLAVLGYARGLESGGLAGAALGWAAAVACSALAMLAKEQGVTALGACLAYDVAVHCGVELLPRPAMRGGGRRGALLLLLRIALTLAAAAALLWYRVQLMGGALPRVFTLNENPASFVQQAPVRLRTYNYLYALNAWLLLAPVTLCCDWSGESIPLVETWADPRNLATAALYAALAALALVGLAARSRALRVRVIMGLALLIIPFLPSTNAFFVVGFVIAERVLYMPSMGYCVLVGSLFCSGSGSGGGGSSSSSSSSSGGVSSSAAGVSEAETDTPTTDKPDKPTDKPTDTPTTDKPTETPTTDTPTTDKPDNRHRHRTTRRTILVAILLAYALRTGLRNRDWQSALTLSLSGVQVNPDNAKLSNNLGEAYLSLDLPDEAEPHLRKAAEQRPGHALAHTNLAALLMRRDELEQAEWHLRRALDSLDPEHVLEVHAKAMSNLGVVLEKRGQLEAAAEQFRECLRFLPDNADVLQNVGHVLDKLERNDEAERYIRWGLHLRPEDPSMHANLGNVLYRQDRVDEAAEHYARALEFDPAAQLPRTNLGIARFKQGALAEAERHLRQALAQDADDRHAHMHLASTLFGAERAAEAEPHFRRAVALEAAAGEPEADSHNNLGTCLLKLERFAEAEEPLRAALALDPGHVDAWVNLGAALQELGEARAGEAVAAYEAAARLEPADPHPHMAISTIRFKRGDLLGADRQLRRVLDVDPAHEGALGNLQVLVGSHVEEGNRLSAAGDLAGALKHYRAVVRTAPTAVDVLEAISNIHYQRGDLDKAAKALRRVLKVEPGHENARRNLAWLTSGGGG